MPASALRVQLGLSGRLLLHLTDLARGRSRHPRASVSSHLLGAASASLGICRSTYYTQEVALFLYHALRAVTLAERGGASNELSLAYANMCIALGTIGL